MKLRGPLREALPAFADAPMIAAMGMGSPETA